MAASQVFQILWLRPEDYPRFRAIFDDVDDTFEEWRARMDRRLVEFSQKGIEIERMLINPDELVAWCRANGRPVDANARAEYPAVLAMERDSRGAGG